jgi:hypothetical protein
VFVTPSPSSSLRSLSSQNSLLLLGLHLKQKEQPFVQQMVTNILPIMSSLLLVEHLILFHILEGYVCLLLFLLNHESPLSPPPPPLPQDLALNSDQFFTLESLPNKVALIGAGYIAVEFAGVLHGLGSDTSLFVRGDTALRNFDPMIRTHLDFCMRRSGERRPSLLRCVTRNQASKFNLALSLRRLKKRTITL